MKKSRLIVHEKYSGNQTALDVFTSIILSNTTALTLSNHSSIIELTDKSQDSLCSGKGVNSGTSES